MKEFKRQISSIPRIYSPNRPESTSEPGPGSLASPETGLYPPPGEEYYEPILDDIDSWYERPDSEPIMWVYTPPSSGMGIISFISQTITETMHLREALSGAYFFSDSSSQTSRTGTMESVVPTLAYQVTQNIPQTQNIIANMIFRDRSIFDLTVEAQLQELLVSPIRQAENTDGQQNVPKTKIFLIFAIEECSDEEFQELFLGGMSNMLSELEQTQYPHKLLVLGRCSAYLQEWFSNPRVQGKVIEKPVPEPEPLLNQMNLTRSILAGEDSDPISKFFREHPGVQRTLEMAGVLITKLLLGL